MGPMRIRRKSRTGRPNGAAHLADLPVAALVDGDGQQRRRPRPLDGGAHVDVRRRRAPALDVDALAELLDAARIRRAHHDHLVDLVHFMPGMHETRGQVAVGHHQQQAFGVVIQPADRVDVRALANQIHHRPPAFRIAPRRHIAFRLVEHDVAMRDLGLDAAAVDLDRVLLGIGLGAELAHGLAVHRSRGPRGSSAPRRDATPRRRPRGFFEVGSVSTSTASLSLARNSRAARLRSRSPCD